MEQEQTSFWNGIKKFEDILAEDPRSYCFAQLSELYRKTGLIDDAINTAEKGSQLLPEYVGGWAALAFAVLEKGDLGRGADLLARVVRATPENVSARNRLVKLYIEKGDLQSAEQLLKIILSIDPDDPDARELYNALWKKFDAGTDAITGGVAAGLGEVPVSETTPEVPVSEAFAQTMEDDRGVAFEKVTDEGVEEEELFLLDDEDLVEEVSDFADNDVEVVPVELPERVEEPIAEPETKDPLTTGTIAELYVAQGFTEKALTIYRELLQNSPGNAAVIARIHELEASVGQTESSTEPVVEPVQGESVSALAANIGAGAEPVEVLQRWLGNIARRR